MGLEVDVVDQILDGVDLQVEGLLEGVHLGMVLLQMGLPGMVFQKMDLQKVVVDLELD